MLNKDKTFHCVFAGKHPVSDFPFNDTSWHIAVLTVADFKPI